MIGTHTPNIYDYWLLSAAQLNVAYTLAETNVLTTNEDSKIILNKLQDFENNIKTMAANTYQLAKAIADTIHYKESIIQPNF